MEKKTSWDDIPSLEGVGVEWEYKAENSMGKRAYVRINADDLTCLFEVIEVFVKIATTKHTYTGRLLDISKGGISLHMPVVLEENVPIKVGFFLGTVKVISKALVRNTRKTDDPDKYITGIQFVDLNEDIAEYIAGLYASKMLYHTSP